MRREDIAIDSPCGMNWDGMKPSEMKKRFCDACKMHVHDLSTMTKREAKDLLASDHTDGLCVRYLHDARGEIVFSDSLVRAKRFAAAAVAIALPMSLTACMGAAPRPRLPEPPVTAEADADGHADAGPPAPMPIAK